MLYCVGHKVPLAPVGTMGPFWPGDSYFRAGGERGLVGCVQGRELGAPSEVYPAEKLQWHFTCGFDFRHSL